MTIRDGSGNILQTTGLVLAPMNHIAFLLADEYPVTAGIQGTVEFQLNNAATENNGVLFGLGLRFDPIGSFTSIQPMLLGVQCVAIGTQ
jgi:hypothetical protein